MHRFEAEAWEWGGEATWVFVTLPAALADEIEASTEHTAGFGSVPVRVVIGDTRWSTSLFPDKARASYVLPLKQAVRRAESIEPGDLVAIGLEVRRP